MVIVPNAGRRWIRLNRTPHQTKVRDWSWPEPNVLEKWAASSITNTLGLKKKSESEMRALGWSDDKCTSWTHEMKAQEEWMRWRNANETKRAKYVVLFVLNKAKTATKWGRAVSNIGRSRPPRTIGITVSEWRRWNRTKLTPFHLLVGSMSNTPKVKPQW